MDNQANNKGTIPPWQRIRIALLQVRNRPESVKKTYAMESISIYWRCCIERLSQLKSGLGGSPPEQVKGSREILSFAPPTFD